MSLYEGLLKRHLQVLAKQHVQTAFEAKEPKLAILIVMTNFYTTDTYGAFLSRNVVSPAPVK